ncbi:MAG TPA: hypothetical protein VK543_08040, partial [Puia sp.]|nr:hypothetical protein [Puia sp.]
MKLFTRPLIILLAVVCFFQTSVAQTGVLNANDTIRIYNPAAPPTTPPFGTLAKWVKTSRMNWNTNSFKCYFYKGVAFRLKFPKSYQQGVNDGKLYPLYFFWHGVGEKGTIYDNEFQLYHGGQVHMNAVDNGKFDGFLLYPQSSASSGFFGNSQYDIIYDLIVNYLIPQVKVDPSRIYEDGLSGGGQATWQFAIKYPKLVAAILPISAASLSFTDGIANLKYTPIWQHQGGLDVNPGPATTTSLMNSYKAAGANITYTIYTTLGHGCWDSAWAETDYYPYMVRAHKANPWALFGRTEFCPGDAISVTIGLTPGFNAYQWRKDGQPITGSSNSIVVTAPGSYDCRYLNGAVWSAWSPTPLVIKIKGA